MKRATRKTRAKSKGVRPMSRRVLAAAVVDLTERLDKHLQIAEAIARGNVPNGEHIYAEYRMRLVFGVLLENQLQSLRDIHGLAHMLSDRVRPTVAGFIQPS
jgi:hypothetical protein